jgi:MOSC domain-containing protein YiiM
MADWPVPCLDSRSTCGDGSDTVPGMGNARIVAVSCGAIAELVVGGKPSRTAISKRPVGGPVAVGTLGLAGDEYGDKANHGGVDQAVYAYAREDLDWWAGRLGRELGDGQFGENITTAGIDVSAAAIGEVWRIGTAVVQITAPRIPCVTFKAWMSEPHWVRRFADARRPGAYLRVLTEGTVGAGDELEVLSRPAQTVTIAQSMDAYFGDRDIMRRLLNVEGRGYKWDEIGAAVLMRGPAGPRVSGRGPSADNLSRT